MTIGLEREKVNNNENKISDLQDAANWLLNNPTFPTTSEYLCLYAFSPSESPEEIQAKFGGTLRMDERDGGVSLTVKVSKNVEARATWKANEVAEEVTLPDGRKAYVPRVVAA